MIENTATLDFSLTLWILIGCMNTFLTFFSAYMCLTIIELRTQRGASALNWLWLLLPALAGMCTVSCFYYAYLASIKEVL